MIIIQSKKAIMAARWVSKEEYEAIVNGTAPAPTNQNDPYYGPTIRLMQTWIRPEIQAMYDAIDFLYSLNIGEIAPLTIL